MLVRPLCAEDAVEVHRLYKYETIPEAHGDWYSIEDFQKMPFMPQIKASVAEVDGKVVGLVVVYDLGFYGYIDCVVVDRQFRNQGIGRELFKYIEQNNTWHDLAMCHRVGETSLGKFAEQNGYKACSTPDFIWQNKTLIPVPSLDPANRAAL